MPLPDQSETPVPISRVNPTTINQYVTNAIANNYTPIIQAAALPPAAAQYRGALVLALGTASTGDVLKDHYDAGSDEDIIIAKYVEFFSFTPSSSYLLNGIALKMKKSAAIGGGSIWFAMQGRDSSNPAVPDKNSLATGIFDFTNVESDNYYWHTLYFNAPYQLSQNVPAMFVWGYQGGSTVVLQTEYNTGGGGGSNYHGQYVTTDQSGATFCNGTIGQTYRAYTGNGTPDNIYGCTRNAGGTFDWHIIA